MAHTKTGGREERAGQALHGGAARRGRRPTEDATPCPQERSLCRSATLNEGVRGRQAGRQCTAQHVARPAPSRGSCRGSCQELLQNAHRVAEYAVHLCKGKVVAAGSTERQGHGSWRGAAAGGKRKEGQQAGGEQGGRT